LRRRRRRPEGRDRSRAPRANRLHKMGGKCSIHAERPRTSAELARPQPRQAHDRLTAPGSPFEIARGTFAASASASGRTRRRRCARCFWRARLRSARRFSSMMTSAPATRASPAPRWLWPRHLAAHGVRKGDRVAIAMRNLPEWPVAFFATILLGAVATPLNAWWTGPELEYGLRDCGASVAIVDSERFERLSEHLHACPDLKLLLVEPSRRRDGASPRNTSRRRHRRAERLAVAAGRAVCPRPHSIPRTTPPSSTPPAPPVIPRARSARIATPR
jgi:hypothetical protein